MNIPLRLAVASLQGTCLLVASLATTSLHGAATNTYTISPIVFGTNGEMTYQATTNGDILPDFSYAGYGAGDVVVPDNPGGVTVSNEIVLSPLAGDQNARIQSAIDTVSKLPLNTNGFRGAVLLKAGYWVVSGSLTIKDSGVVLRGEGNNPYTGTRLHSSAVTTDADNNNTKKSSFLVIKSRLGGISTDSSRTATITNSYVPVGADSFSVDNVAAFKVGDMIQVRRPENQAWINAIGMTQYYTPTPVGINWTRKIVAIEGSKITIDVPLSNSLDQKYGGGNIVAIGLDDSITNVGVESLYVDCQFASPSDENHHWNVMEMDNVADGFVQDVTSRYFAYTMNFVDPTTRRVTIQRCQFLDPVSQVAGGRRYSFLIDGQQTLIRNCYARYGRHDFVQDWIRIPGPNAFVDCKSDLPSTYSGSHMAWASGTLWDNVNTWELYNNKDGSHGWYAANSVFWNSGYKLSIIQAYSPPTANFWIFGCMTASNRLTGNGTIISEGTAMPTRSLYDAQLADRMSQIGKTYTPQPSAIPIVIPVYPVVSGGSVSASTNAAFTYTIQATELPVSYSASALPKGLVLNRGTGVISGTPVLPIGTTNQMSSIKISAKNHDGWAATNAILKLTIQ